MIKCNKCDEYIEIPRLYSEIRIMGIHYRFKINNMWAHEDNLDYFFHLLLEKVKKSTIINYKEFEIQINHEGTVVCEKCGANNHFYVYKSIADEFNFYISNYISTLLESISLKNIKLSLDDFGYQYSDIYQKLASSLPLRYLKEKIIIKKLLRIQKKLPVIGGKGGEEELLQWIIQQTLDNTFTYIFSIIVGYGLYFGKHLIHKRKVKNIIRKAIDTEKYYLQNISMEDITKYLEIPKGFSSSKEELIEKIIYEKALQYKNEIIEKIRCKQ